MKQITKQKKNQNCPYYKHLQTTNLMWLKTEICLQKKRKHSKHCPSLTVKFATNLQVDLFIDKLEFQWSF